MAGIGSDNCTEDAAHLQITVRQQRRAQRRHQQHAEERHAVGNHRGGDGREPVNAVAADEGLEVLGGGHQQFIQRERLLIGQTAAARTVVHALAVNRP